MKRIFVIVILCISVVAISSCSSIAKMVFGIEELKQFDSKRVDSFLAESPNTIYCAQIVATKEQVDSIIRLDLDSNMMQHRAQPVQILYFSGDSLVFYHINCYTQSGFMSYDWNNYGSFSRFPPSPTIVEDVHGSMSFDRYKTIFPELKSSTRYTIIILWSNMLRKVSRNAVDAVARSVTGHGNCTIILINTDQWWVNYLNKSK